MNYYTKILAIAIIVCMHGLNTHSFGQRNMERLDRGLVAIKTNTGVFLSWRIYGNDPADVAFNIYRDGTKVNSTPITGATNITDASGTANSAYAVRPIINGQEQEIDGRATVWSSQVLTINLNRPPSGTTPKYEVTNNDNLESYPNGQDYSYEPNDINVGDLDGDGQYELVVKWNPTNARDNSHGGITGPVYIDAYKLDGTFLWRVSLGINIRAGAHYTQHLVADFDGDGKAEMICKTAPGTKDGTNTFLSKGPAANDNDNVDHRTKDSWPGFIIEGGEYLTIFNGETGAEMQTVTFEVGRGVTDSWGKTRDNTNRVDRFNSTIAYLDGKKPSAVFNRGYYGKMTHSAWDWDGSRLTNRWIFNSVNPGNGAAAGNGNHSMMAADVDGDGFDEIFTGSAAIDHNGTFMWSTGFGHGDANHIGDLDPNNPGLEIWQVTEDKNTAFPDHYMIDARTGNILWQSPGGGNDNGRGMCGDIDGSRNGQEAWSNSVEGIYSCTGSQISKAKGSSNFRVYWDGDLQDELLDGNKLDKWNGNGTTRLITLQGNSSNGTKSTPNLSADIIGDWREEVILHNGSDKLYLSATTIPTEHRLYTLMHDPVYRNAISWQQSSYNQPPHLGFFLGAGTDKAPKPNINLVGSVRTDCNGDAEGSAYLDECGTCVGGNTGLTECSGSIQIENNCSAQGTEEQDHAGYNGTGYINMANEIGSEISIMLHASQAGTSAIGLRYANGSDANRPMTLSINGKTMPISFEPTGEWTAWKTEIVTADLQEGGNMATLTSNSSDGGPNIDQINIYDQSISQGSCTTDCNGVQGGTAYMDKCGECVEGNTGKQACTQDCSGEWGGTAYTDECGMCIGGNTALVACTSKEAEDIEGYENFFEATNANYSGTGYVNTENIQGSGITFYISSAKDQNASISILFANGSAENRPAAVIVNNTQQINSLDFAGTAAWTTWETTTATIALTAGKNEITLEASTAGGLPNIDKIWFNTPDLIFSTKDSPGEIPTEKPCQTITVNKGWNLIGIACQAQDMSVASLLKDVDFTAIKDIESFYEKGREEHLNSLKNLSYGKGYMILCNTPSVINIPAK